jgi:uncharacterized membrane protein YbaN (DUF454 family)
MILYDRMFSPYVRRLANKTVVVEKSKLNLLVSDAVYLCIQLWYSLNVYLVQGAVDW